MAQWLNPGYVSTFFGVKCFLFHKGKAYKIDTEYRNSQRRNGMAAGMTVMGVTIRSLTSFVLAL